MTAIAEIVSPGLLTTIQDLGRPHLRHLGVPLSGAADKLSFALANAAAGNSADAPGLECTLKGPALRLRSAATFALGGADDGGNETLVHLHGRSVLRPAAPSFCGAAAVLCCSDLVMGNLCAANMTSPGHFHCMSVRAGDRQAGRVGTVRRLIWRGKSCPLNAAYAAEDSNCGGIS